MDAETFVPLSPKFNTDPSNIISSSETPVQIPFQYKLPQIQTLSKKSIGLSNYFKCYDISVFLDAMFRKAKDNDEYVDIYFETSYIHKIGPSHLDIDVVDPLSKTLKIFNQCMARPEVYNCPYSNTRFHYVDVRQGIQEDVYLSIIDVMESINDIIVNHINDLESYYNAIAIRISLVHHFLSNKMDITLFKIYLNSPTYNYHIEAYLDNIKQKLKMDLDDEDETQLFNEFSDAVKSINSVHRYNSNSSRIKIQLDELRRQGDEKIANDILEFMFNRYIEIRTKIDFRFIPDLMNDVNNIIDGKTDKSIKNVRLIQVDTKFYALGALLMDTYTLARMFRTFPNNKHNDSSYVVTYTGSVHSRTYNDFFRYYLNVDMDKYQMSHYERCIKVNPERIL